MPGDADLVGEREPREPAPRKLTVDEYLALAATGAFENQRVELLDGVIYEMSPISALHDHLVRRLTRLLARCVREGFDLNVQGCYPASNLSMPEPDFTIARTPHGVDYLRDALLLIEVAVSSLDHDLGRKARIYGRAGIPEYWVIDAEARTTIVHRGPTTARSRNGYTQIVTRSADEVIACLALPEIAVRLADLYPRDGD